MMAIGRVANGFINGMIVLARLYYNSDIYFSQTSK